MKTKEILIISTGLVVCALILGIFFYAGRKAEKTIRVIGYASKGFESDIVKWTLTVTSNTSLNDVTSGYRKLKEQVNSLIEALGKKGLESKEVTVQPPSVSPIWEDGRQTGYAIRQSLFIITKNVSRVESLASDPDFIYEKGILLENSVLEYNYTKIDELKKELLAAATKDAISRAQEIARSAGARIGKITSARQGVFQITEPYSTEVSDYGIYSTATKNKDIRVTVTVTFAIR
ncbi:SIMPL domain-containing protein [candidate division WOR-3 bacterium]|nr:SIMPL domain-containing protein [candidate division WOR-3 bacterium]